MEVFAKGYRKITFGVITTAMSFLAAFLTPTNLAFFLGIYACFVIGNMIEHLTEKRAAEPLGDMLGTLEGHLSKITTSQETTLQALQFLVQTVQQKVKA